jgi:FlaG/FlaF family flagellin (archaellin)
MSEINKGAVGEIVGRVGCGALIVALAALIISILL